MKINNLTCSRILGLDSIDTNLYFIKNGSLRIYVIDEFEEHTIRFGYQNNFIVHLIVS